MRVVSIVVGSLLVAGVAPAAAGIVDQAALRAASATAQADELCNYCEDYAAPAKTPSVVRTSYRAGTGTALAPIRQ